jgi:hypothetical protein
VIKNIFLYFARRVLKKASMLSPNRTSRSRLHFPITVELQVEEKKKAVQQVKEAYHNFSFDSVFV